MGGYRCHICGKDHDEPPFAFGAEYPASWYAVPEAERSSRCESTPDFCTIDGTLFFVRGNIEISVFDTHQRFSWGVWVSLSETSFKRSLQLLTTAGREREAPYFGWLNTFLPLYPETLNLKTLVHTQPVGTRPLIELEPTDHPLAVEQRQGISLQRVREIASKLLHAE